MNMEASLNYVYLKIYSIALLSLLLPFFFIYLLHLYEKYAILLEMLSVVPFHLHRIYDKFTEMLQRNDATFFVDGGWFPTFNMVATSNPVNVHYIMSKNFSNYPKGPENKKTFDLLGDMLFNADHNEWRKDRKMAHSLFGSKNFYQNALRINMDRLENGLIPVLDHFSKQGLVVDLQDLFERLMVDATSLMVTGFNPGSLCVGFPNVPLTKAVSDAGEGIFMRLVMPEAAWKIKRWLGIGTERKLKKAREILEEIAAKYIAMKKEELKQAQLKPSEEKEEFDALKLYLRDNKDVSYGVMRDTIVGLMFVGRGTGSAALTWFFWILSKHPLIESKIQEELDECLGTTQLETEEKYRMFDVEQLNKLVFLRAALLETIRLFPPAPLQQRVAVESDVLPSGHRVKAKTKILLSSYAMGRMKSLWGEDCLEFKPERWISKKGGINHEPSYKFLVFSSGPRMCPGKELGFMKIMCVAATVIYNYHVQVVKDHPVAPVNSILLHMKYGLKVMVSRRSG